MTNVKTRACTIIACIDALARRFQQLAQTCLIRHLVDEAAFFDDIDEIHDEPLAVRF